jgi:hypothetical protein
LRRHLDNEKSREGSHMYCLLQTTNRANSKRSEAHPRTHAHTHLTRRSLPSLIARGRHLAWTSVGREWPSLETAFRRRRSIPTESHRAGKVTVGSKTPAIMVRTSASALALSSS